MDIEAIALARRAAAPLAVEFDPALAVHLEEALQNASPSAQTYEVATGIALATLLLNVAKLAWDIYKNAQKRVTQPEPTAITQKLLLEVTLPAGITRTQYERVVDVVVDQLPRA